MMPRETITRVSEKMVSLRVKEAALSSHFATLFATITCILTSPMIIISNRKSFIKENTDLQNSLLIGVTLCFYIILKEWHPFNSIAMHILSLTVVSLCIYKECFGNVLAIKNMCWALSAISILSMATITSHFELAKVFGQLNLLLRPYFSFSIIISATISQMSMWYFEKEFTKVYSYVVLSSITLAVLSYMFYCLLTSQWWNNQLITQSESYTKLADVSEIIQDRD